MSVKSDIDGFIESAKSLCDEYDRLLDLEISTPHKDANALRPDHNRISIQEDRIFPLDSTLLEQFERAFGRDLKNVRIHVGPEADILTNNAGARALAMGNDLYFHSGNYQPDTDEGLKLIAHELTHVIQHQDGSPMVFHEDIDDLEFIAEMIEEKTSDIGLHNINQPLLNPNDSIPTLNLSDSMRNESEALKKGTDKKDKLDGFTGKRRETIYEVYLTRINKVYRVTAEQKDKVLNETWNKVMNELDNRISVLPIEEKELAILNYLKMYGGSNL